MVSNLFAGSSLASVHQLELDHPPLHPHSLEALRQEYPTEKAQHDHFALGQLAEKVQESALGRVHLQSQVGGDYNLEWAPQ